MRGKKRLIIIIPIIAIAAVLSYRFVLSKSNSDPNTIRVSGNIETTEAEVSFKIAGRVDARLVDEGETIAAGQPVARLDSAELAQETAIRAAELQAAEAALAELEAGSRPEDIAQAEAAVLQARARLAELVAGSRLQEVAAAEAALAGARAETMKLDAEYARHKGLYNNGVISAQLYDAVRTSYETALATQRATEEQLKLVREGPRREQIDQARAALLQAQEGLALIRNGPRKETIEQARARAQQAREALAQAQTRLSYTAIVSPMAGMTLSKNIEPGEHVGAGTPVVTIGDLENVWLRAYVVESDLGRVKPGQRVRVTTDTYPGKVYEGRISFIASEAEFTPKNVQTEKERVKLVYRIKIDIPNPDMELKPGMPADAEILLLEDAKPAASDEDVAKRIEDAQ